MFWVHAEVVGALHGNYHDAFETILDAEADGRDTCIGHIANLSSIRKPKPPREVLAITPIEFSVLIPKFPKLLPHLPPID